MECAVKLGFDTIATYSVISDYMPGKPIDSSGINNGDSVTLKYSSEWVTVRAVKVIGNGIFQGVIDGFDPSFKCSFNKLNVGDEIEFKENNVFTCIREC